MASINVFPACRMRSFAALVTREFGVQVRLRGREICVRLAKPPIIFLPNLEYAREQDLLPIYGFCLHEAAHIAYTNPAVTRDCPNYLVKFLHNAIEDVFIERRLERRFPGAREMLTCAYVDGIKLVCGGGNPVGSTSFLSREGREKVLEFMDAAGMDSNDGGLVEAVAKRLEIDRVAKLWILAAREYPVPLMDWGTHPWRAVFEQETAPRAKSTKDTYAQALCIIERLGVKPVLPTDTRPIEKLAEARTAKEAAKEARRLLRQAKANADAEIRKASEGLPERSALKDAAEKARQFPESEEAKDAVEQTREKFEEACRQIRGEAQERRAPEVAALSKEASGKSAVAKAAKAAAKLADELIKTRDAEISPAVAKGAMKSVVDAQIEKFKAEKLDDELGTPKAPKPEGASGELDGHAADFVGVRKYTPFDRSMDRVEKVTETPEARTAHNEARVAHARIIRETIERMRRLHSPKLAKLKCRAPEGRLDPRKASTVGLGLRGAPVDLRNVWRAFDDKKDPAVAVSLLIDCSGSMMSSSGASGQSRISLARQAAACLSEVFSALGLPHEILGHTTDSGGICELNFSDDDASVFSRVVPFKGYAFKSFEEKTPMGSVFSKVALNDNLDGEAVLWAVQRLAARREKTKLAIVICDGLPCAETAVVAELERHLYTVCKQVEARENEGLHLCALGIGLERAKAFYKNAEVINAVEDLPCAVLGIVERVLAGLGGR